MLEEFMAFNGEKFPPQVDQPPIYSWTMKLSKSKDKSLISKNNSNSLSNTKEERRLSIENEVTRQLEEEERLEEQKKRILKELHKKKRMNIKKFLLREAGYEQKKVYNLEQRKILLG